jgi:hypothetical protein
MTANPVPADAETTTLISRVDAPQAPLPPYAQQHHAGAATHPPLTSSAPPPPPAGAPTVTDAMIEISMPPLADVAAAPTAAVEVLPPESAASAPVAAPSPTSAPTANGSGVVIEPTIAAAMPPPATEVITCPECGTTAQVTLNRREAMDFCRTCDYPLFWTPSKVVRDGSDTTSESLRRLPGQAGKATVASVPCPFCYEPNALSAQTCLRCGRPMHPVAEVAPPPPVYIAPEPVAPPPPAQKVAWWVWALLALGAAAVVVLIVLIATHTIG